ncbi:MAG: medium-chain acyl-[acyl-carrier-protein] hydrolase [Pseudohongiellaceae bacterium]|jgi:medium-chain acyl-[acyl-carrier-protein] hydrolase
MSKPTRSTTLRQKDPWFPLVKEQPQAKVRLFCLPYAGAGASVFRPWQAALGESIEVLALQSPGRETRLRERPFDNMQGLVAAMHEALLPRLDERPFAIFGHSVGALEAWELTRLLVEAGGPQPVHLFVGGARAPLCEPPEKLLYNLSRAELLVELGRLNGTPQAVLENDEVMDLFLPMIRADFTITDCYRREDAQPLPVPLTLFTGHDDPEVPEHKLAAWGAFGPAGFARHDLPGDHFFLHSEEQRLLAVISETLAEV